MFLRNLMESVDLFYKIIISNRSLLSLTHTAIDALYLRDEKKKNTKLKTVHRSILN